jgi:hypothetical protein
MIGYDTLAEETTGLRYVRLGWGSTIDTNNLYPFERGAIERGLGDNLDFVRALGKIQGLKELVIEGEYAKNWPIYLEKRMSVRVKAICGREFEENELVKGDPTKEQLKHQKFIRALNERSLNRFTVYQQGTEDLIP